MVFFICSSFCLFSSLFSILICLIICSYFCLSIVLFPFISKASIILFNSETDAVGNNILNCLFKSSKFIRFGDLDWADDSNAILGVILMDSNIFIYFFIQYFWISFNFI